MEGIVRVAAVSSLQHSANPGLNRDNIIKMCRQLPEADIVLLPQLALSSPCCGSLFSWETLLVQCRTALNDICVLTKATSAYYIVGLPVYGQQGAASAVAVIQGGRILGFVPAMGEQATGLSHCNTQGMLDHDTVFDCGGLGFCVMPCDPNELPRYMHKLDKTGCKLVLVPAAVPAKAGELDQICRTLEVVSESWSCAVAVASTGPGGSSSPKIYAGITGIFEKGKQLCFNASLYEECCVVYDLDPQMLATAATGGPAIPVFSTMPKPKKNLIRTVDPDPYTDGYDKPRLFHELFELQAASIAHRLKNTGL